MQIPPWWLDTQAILISGETGVFLYGEIKPIVQINQLIYEGQLIGYVQRVLRNDKGKPLSMLHLELYTKNTTKSTWWYHNQQKPENLLDPTPYLEKMLNIKFSEVIKNS